MVGRRAAKREAGSGDAPPLTSATILANGPTANIKYRILNTNLKLAIKNCKILLENELRKTNNAMREKIQEWISRDATNIPFNGDSNNNELSMTHENELMRQMLSDLVNGPLTSLLSNVERKKLVKLVIPTLSSNPYSDDRREVDFFQAYDSQTSLYEETSVGTSSMGNSNFEDLRNKNFDNFYGFERRY